MVSYERRVVEILRHRGVARTRDLVAAGIARSQLSRMVAAGKLARLARGLYALPDYQPGEYDSLIIVAQRAPEAVFCLLTALRFHDLTTQAPFEVWIAIGSKGYPPRLDHPPLRSVRVSARLLTAETGVETQRIGGTRIRVTGVARTVADCFKFRNRIGLDVALEALREARRSRKVSMDDLWHCAKLDRVANVMRPYLESLE